LVASSTISSRSADLHTAITCTTHRPDSTAHELQQQQQQQAPAAPQAVLQVTHPASASGHDTSKGSLCTTTAAAKCTLAGAAHLPSSTLALCCPLNDTRQIQQLYLGVVVMDDTRDACQRGELIRSCLRVCARELSQQRGLSHRGKTCVRSAGGGGDVSFASSLQGVV
jgi:hypothetical protein